MTSGHLSRRVVTDRIQWVQSMLQSIRNMPIHDPMQFHTDPRNALACESCLRRALKALLDLGRHILTKQFAIAVEEYKEIGPALAKHGVISNDLADQFRTLAGYRNRMVHFYHEVSNVEIQDICANHLEDLEMVLEALRCWLSSVLESPRP
ncbi:type VII toxin-antitoxin system HepT family RNase toxin [Desulfonatronum lacustre]|uniref:type VII toxin-antitoxin system HepT family RNase toxin n=1 Tax=Desulfonatronum lacustre TaxID=66849 RepID=UPI00048F12C1|nr:DUF86 domain-containing protein [Desulfonatronum lacustre]